MRNNGKPIVPTHVATAGDLVDLARTDHDTYRRRQESARSIVRISGPTDVLADLRERLDQVLTDLDPAVGAVALAATIATLTK
ncbi:hypothetical protein [Gordonia terrae]